MAIILAKTITAIGWSSVPGEWVTVTLDPPVEVPIGGTIEMGMLPSLKIEESEAHGINSLTD